MPPVSKSKKRPAGRAPKTPGKCVFCGGTGVTKEHIWADWIKNVIPGSPTNTQITSYQMPDYSTKTLYVVPAAKERQGRLDQRKIRNVCGGFNNGWMGRIVERAKPFVERMIQGMMVELDGGSQRDLATWIAIATTMGEFMDVSTAAIPPDDRRIVLTTEAPPEQWTIFLGRYSGRTWHPIRYRHIGLKFNEIDLPGPRGSNDSNPDKMQVTTYALGSLLIHAFSSTSRRKVSRFRRSAAQKNLFRLWPLRHGVLDWPIGPILGDDEVPAF